MNLNEKAAEASRDVHLTGDMAYSTYQLQSEELVPADEISDEGEFPQYGDFAEASIPTSSEGDDPELFVEVCGDLASGLVELGVGEGDVFRVGATEKVDGEWRVDVEEASDRLDDDGDGEES